MNDFILCASTLLVKADEVHTTSIHLKCSQRKSQAGLLSEIKDPAVMYDVTPRVYQALAHSACSVCAFCKTGQLQNHTMVCLD